MLTADCFASIPSISGVIGSLEAIASKVDSAATRTVGSIRNIRNVIRGFGKNIY